MKTLVVSDVLSNNAQVPSPGVLCFYQDDLCVADQKLTAVYELIPVSTPPAAPLSNKNHAALKQTATPIAATSPTATATPLPPSLKTLGNAKGVLALTVSEGVLYAFLQGGLLVKVGLPDSSDVKFQTPWGFMFKNTDYQQSIPFFTLPDDMAGFLASPTEPRKFYIATKTSIISVKDYDFENRWDCMVGGMESI